MRGAKIVLSTLQTLDSALLKVPSKQISQWLEKRLVTTRLARVDLLLARAADCLTQCSAIINSTADESSSLTLASVDPKTIEHLQRRNSIVVLAVSEVSYSLGVLESLSLSEIAQLAPSWDNELPSPPFELARQSILRSIREWKL